MHFFLHLMKLFAFVISWTLNVFLFLNEMKCQSNGFKVVILKWGRCRIKLSLLKYKYSPKCFIQSSAYSEEALRLQWWKWSIHVFQVSIVRLKSFSLISFWKSSHSTSERMLNFACGSNSSGLDTFMLVLILRQLADKFCCP